MIGNDAVIRRTWVMVTGSNGAFKIAAKPLHIETWLLLSQYRYSSLLYITAPLSTTYNVQFSHNTCVTDRRQRDDASYGRTQGSIEIKGRPKTNLLRTQNSPERILQQFSTTAWNFAPRRTPAVCILYPHKLWF